MIYILVARRNHTFLGAFKTREGAEKELAKFPDRELLIIDVEIED